MAAASWLEKSGNSRTSESSVECENKKTREYANSGNISLAGQRTEQSSEAQEHAIEEQTTRTVAILNGTIVSNGSVVPHVGRLST